MREIKKTAILVLRFGSFLRLRLRYTWDEGEDRPCYEYCNECRGGIYNDTIMNERFASIDDIYRDNLYSNDCIEIIENHLENHH